MAQMKITIIGTGYVGLVSGVCFADAGHDTVCVDLDAQKVERLRAGDVPIYEPGLDALMQRAMEAGALKFTTQLDEAAQGADVIIIAVGTPEGEDGSADLRYVYAAARQIAPLLSGYTVIVTKSTVPIGTGDEVEAILREANPTAEFDVVSNPEFLREGVAVDDFRFPDRVIIGTDSARARVVMERLYAPFQNPKSADFPLEFVNRRTSELIKYAGNAYLAMKITFINEMADLCEAVGADIGQVARGIGLDHRIGLNYLSAGPGYGGSCFPKDTQAVGATARKHATPLRLIETVVDVNASRKRAMAERVIDALGGNAQRKTVALLGLAFKPDTDDMRESPAIDLVQGLLTHGVHIRAYDPEAMVAARRVLPPIAYADDAYNCVENADCVVIVTEWPAFKALDIDRLKSAMRAPVMVDLRNLFDPDGMRASGFTYRSIGRA